MSQEETLQHTINRQQIQPKKVLQQIEDSKQQSVPNDSKIVEPPKLNIVKSNSQNSLNNVNLAQSLLNQPQQKYQDGQNPPEEDNRVKMPQGFFYDDNHLEFIHPDSPITEDVVKLDGFYGHDSFKRYNALVLDRDTIIYASGISYTIFNHFTKDKKLFYSRDKGGIGSIAVHPSKKYFAIAQMGTFPNIYIYEYPSLKLYRILRKGTQKSYSSVNFSGKGDTLASVGSQPDFLLTVWQWKHERLLLKSKAFSQDIYRVSFSQFNEKWLTTSGTGHIRFWKISQTFTGLKLQGDIAKFGQFELSDVVSFAQYEDANVLSSSQYGKLLLWQGNVIKSVVAISPEKPCHNGTIQYVRNYKKKIISCGSDGYIRFWDAQSINQGESDEQFNFYIKPQKQIYFQTPQKKPAYLNWIQIEEDYWIIQDALGSLWKYQPQIDRRQLILTFNSGKFTDFAISPLNNCIVSTSNDGSVRLWDYGNRKEFYTRKFATNAQATCIDWLPFSKKNNGRMLVVGFSDGIVRFIGLQDKRFVLIKAFKVHKNAITKVKCNRQGSIVVVSDNSGSLFFLSINDVVISKITPYCLFETGFKINDLTWERTGDKILLACQDGKLHEINTPKEKDCDFNQTYLRPFTSRSYVIKMLESQKPNREQLELELLLKKTKGGAVDQVVVDQQWQPAPIMNACYYGSDSSKILCSVQGKYLGFFYIVDFNKERPVGSIQVPKYKTSYLHYSESTQLIFIGYRNGTWELRHRYQPTNYLRKNCFDHNYGIVRKLALNIENTALISASQDGTLLVHKFDHATYLKGTKSQYIDKIQISIPTVLLGISAANFSDKLDFGKDADVDITDNSIYSLQDQKLKAEEDMKLSQAQKIKLRKIKKIKQLQILFQEIVQANKKQTDKLAKLTPEEMIVDPAYTEAFQKRVDQEEEQTRKQLAWDEEYASKKRRKLQDYFINNLQYNKFSVKGINKQNIVSSFKMTKVTPYIQAELQKIQQIIKEEQLSTNGDKKDKTSSNFEMSKAILQMKLKQKKGKQENQQVKNKIRQAQNQFQKQLAQANATKGDYKLKCSLDYDVPQNERLNVSRKKKHLFLHYQYLFQQKKEFNRRLNDLRLKKKELLQKLEPNNEKLRKLNQSLGIQQEDGFFFQIDQDIELLETQIEVTEEDIQEHLVRKQKEKQANKKTTGMGMASTQDKQTKNTETQKIKKPKKKKPVLLKKQQKFTQQIKARANLKIKKSEIGQQLQEIRKIQMQAEKQKIKQDFTIQICKFDEELQNLKNIKYQLQSDLNLVQMKIITYSQEFIIFRDMETFDMQLMDQLKTLGAEKTLLQSNFMSLTTQISQIQILNEQCKRKFQEQKKILRQFVYPDDDIMRQRIIRYYKIRQRKRISKLKKQAQIQQKQKESQQGGDEQDQQEQEQQEQESQSQDEFDDEDQKPDITVIENDHKNFERVRKICQYDQKIEELSKKKSDLQKQRNQINNKIKTISTSLFNAEKDLKNYQKKKLLKINQVYVSLPISFSQIQYHVRINNKLKLQEDFSNAILFTKTAFNRLGQRIVQLQKETHDIVKKETNLKKKLGKLNEQVEKSSTIIQQKRKQYEEKQLLKFGNTFEIEKLKQLEPNDQLKETRELYKKQERQVTRRIEQIKGDLQQRKRQLLQSKKQNTKVINEITQLGDRQNQLKKKLDSTNKQLFKNYDASKKDQLQKERQNLKDLIKFLSKEIEDLKTEIGLFKRKGGHIYTMVTSNKKNFS